MRTYLDFESGGRIGGQGRGIARHGRERQRGVAVGRQISRLEVKAAVALKELYADLTPWQISRAIRSGRIARLYRGLIESFIPLAGDRKFGDDDAIVGGFGRFRGESVRIIGHEESGLRQAQFRHGDAGRLPQGGAAVHMADRFGLPVIRVVWRLSRRRRGRARPGPSRARLTRASGWACPIAVITARAGRGRARHRRRQPRVHAGALNLFGDLAGRLRLHSMARHRQGAGCGSEVEDYRAGDVAFGVIDTAITEPIGGAHRGPAAAIAAAGEAIANALAELHRSHRENVRRQRRGRHGLTPA